MTSQQSSQPANVTTAADEISRFARYVEFRTRGLRETVATYLGTNTTTIAVPFHEEEEDAKDLFVDVGLPDEGWVGVTDEAIEVPEVCYHHSSFIHTKLRTSSLTVPIKDASQQMYHPPPTPPPGPIQQTARPPTERPYKLSASQEPTSNSPSASSQKT